jgi:hypothetical protein
VDVKAYRDTAVSVEKSMGELRAMLRKHGCEDFHMGQRGDRAELGFRHHTLRVRMRVPIVPMTEPEAREYASARRKGFEAVWRERDAAAERQVWRVLFWLLKTRMEAVEAGVETFTEAFLPHLVHPETGETVYEALERAGAIGQLALPSPEAA